MNAQEIIEKIRAEIERLKHTDIPHTDEWWDGADYVRRRMKEVLSDLEKSEKPTLQEQPVCEDVEEAAKAYADDINSNECLYTYTDFTDAFKAGAKWQKEQMLKEAVEGEIINAGYPTKIELNTFYSKFEHGQKVKLIIIKED